MARRSTIPPRLAVLAVASTLLAACAMQPLDPGPAPAAQASLERAIAAYYHAFASEERGLCTDARMEAITRLRVVEDRGEQLVVDVRYFYLDRIRNQRSRNDCNGFNERRFLVERTAAGYEVLGMNGEHGAPIGVRVGLPAWF